MLRNGGLAVEDDFAGAIRDFHQLCRIGAEMVGTRKDDSESFFRAIGEQDRVRDDLSFEVNIGLGYSGNVGEFHLLQIGRGASCDKEKTFFQLGELIPCDMVFPWP